MPMIELTTTKGALDDDAKQQLAGELSTIALELEAAPMADFGGDEHMQALAWCFVNEQEVFVGGRRHAKPIYRVTVTIPDWAGFGEVVTIADIAAYSLKTDEPGSKTNRMRHAAMESVGASATSG